MGWQSLLGRPVFLRFFVAAALLLSITGCGNAVRADASVSTPSSAPSVEVFLGIYTIHFPKGRSMEAYLDPGKPGLNAIHIVYFDADGTELAMAADITVEVSDSQVSGLVLPTKQFGPGHFIAQGTLPAGKLRVVINGTAANGDRLRAVFDTSIAA